MSGLSVKRVDVQKGTWLCDLSSVGEKYDSLIRGQPSKCDEGRVNEGIKSDFSSRRTGQ